MTFSDVQPPEYERLGLLPLERAFAAYLRGEDPDAAVGVHSDSGVGRPLPISLLFRDPMQQAFAWDMDVLGLARGRVLDVGAGAGALSLALQRQGLEVTALDVLPSAVAAMRSRGVNDVRLVGIDGLVDEGGFDTVLLVMNGSMLAGTLSGLEPLLGRLASLLRQDGQILLDSTDLRADGADPELRPDGRYVGEVQYQLTYRGLQGPPVPQLFVDPDTLATVAAGVGLMCEVVAKAPAGGYLSRLRVRAERPGP